MMLFPCCLSFPSSVCHELSLLTVRRSLLVTHERFQTTCVIFPYISRFASLKNREQNSQTLPKLLTVSIVVLVYTCLALLLFFWFSTLLSL